MIPIIKAALAALIHSIATRPMLFWAARKAASYSKTKTDDNLVELAIAMEDGNVEKIQGAIKKLVDDWDVKL